VSDRAKNRQKAPGEVREGSLKGGGKAIMQRAALGLRQGLMPKGQTPPEANDEVNATLSMGGSQASEKGAIWRGAEWGMAPKAFSGVHENEKPEMEKKGEKEWTRNEKGEEHGFVGGR